MTKKLPVISHKLAMGFTTLFASIGGVELCGVLLEFGFPTSVLDARDCADDQAWTDVPHLPPDISYGLVVWGKGSGWPG